MYVCTLFTYTEPATLQISVPIPILAIYIRMCIRYILNKFFMRHMLHQYLRYHLKHYILYILASLVSSSSFIRPGVVLIL